jgi:hypothetical protein
VNPGTGRGLVVGLSLQANQGTVQSVTYNGVALTEIGSRTRNGVQVQMWWLANPSTGTASISVTTSGAVKIVGGATSFLGVSSSNPIDSFSSNVGTSSNASVSASILSLNLSQVMIDTVASDGNAVPIAPGGGQTSRWNRATGSSGGDMVGGGSTDDVELLFNNMSWSLDTSRDWAIGVMVLNSQC